MTRKKRIVIALGGNALGNTLPEQMAAVKKMGGMKGILSKLPGGQRALNQMGGNLDEKIFDRNEAIIHSMTKAERLKPSIINGQRRARIARGSGTTPADVNSLMKQWGEMNKMMGKMRSMQQQVSGKKGKKGKKMRMPGIPGMGGVNMNQLMNQMGGMGGGMSDMDKLMQMNDQFKRK